jgi:hypothetical protein
MPVDFISVTAIFILNENYFFLHFRPYCDHWQSSEHVMQQCKYSCELEALAFLFDSLILCWQQRCDFCDWMVWRKLLHPF